jgi:tRNA 2-thiocytidine biosynthesis protein TtcA
MVPAQSMFQGKFTVIRPLAYTDEDTIRRFASESKFPEFINPCPTSQTSKRKEIKTMLHQLYCSNRKIKGNIFRALSHYKPEYLLKP